MDIQLLGPLRAYSDQGREIPLGGAKPRAVLALLASNAGRAVDTDTIVEDLWPNAEAAAGRKTVQAYVSRLRGVLAEHGAPDAIRTHLSGYELDPSIAIDAQRFEAALTEAGALIHERPADAARLLEQASRLWHGRPFQDAYPTHRLELEAQRLEERRWAATEAWAEARLALGRHRELIADLRRITAEDPLRERPWALLMLALYRAGRQAEALAIYPEVARRLRDELGVEPSPELSELQVGILGQDPSLGPPAGPIASGLARRWRRGSRRWTAIGTGVIAIAVVAVVAVVAAGTLILPSSARGLTLRPVSQIEVPTGAVQAVGSGQQVWVAAHDDAAVLAVTQGVGTVRYPLPGVPSAIASGLGAIWVASTSAGAIWKIDRRTGAVVGAQAGLELRGPALAVGSDAVWVIRENIQPFLRVDPDTLAVQILPFVDGYGGPIEPGLAVANGRLWGSNAYIGRIMSLDPASASGDFAGDPRIGEHPARSIIVDRGAVWFSQPTNGSVTRVDAATRAVTATVGVGRTSSTAFGQAVAPYALSGGPGGVWVAMPDDGAVALLDDDSAVEVARLDLSRPVAIAPTLGGDVWVLDANTDELVQVRTGSCTPLPFIGPGADLRGCDLSQKVLVGVDLAGADLRWADLRDTAAQMTDLTGADLLGADLSGAALEGVTWDATRCPDGSLSDQHGGRCQ